MPMYVQLATCFPRALVDAPPSLSTQVALDRAFESIAVLCEELEHAQAQLAEATGDVSTQRYEAMRADRDHWRETAETTHRKLAVIRRKLAELAGESA